jgi:two-component system, OmpR family, sensor kinase
MFSIKTRLILSYSLMFEIVLIVYSVFIHRTMKDAAISTLDTRLVSTAGRFEDELEEAYHDNQTIGFNDILLAKTQLPSQFSLRLWDSTGQAVYSDSLLAGLPRTNSGDAAPGDTRFDITRIGQHRYRTVVLPLRISGRPFYLAQFVAPMHEIDASLSQLNTIFYISFPLAFFLSALAGYLIVRVGFRPLSVMIESAQNISEKNLDERLPVPTTNDEVKTLGITFNTMIERIEAAFHSQRQFIADASHEIRSPLTIISAELEYAQRSLHDGNAKDSIRISLEEVDHLKHITEDLLLLAKLDARQVQLNRTTFRFDELLADGIRKVKHVAAVKGITVQLKVATGIEFNGDAEKIGSVIGIIMDNAVKYSFTDTVVGVDLSLLYPDQIQLRVSNCGIGILPSDLPHIFDRFFRADASRNGSGGSGLGLAIARSIVELHGGIIAASSIPQGTTEFIVSLPMIDHSISVC